MTTRPVRDMPCRMDKRLLIAFALVGCGGMTSLETRDGDTSAVPACIPGESASCGCTDGHIGAQICGRDGTYGACSCTGAFADAGEPPARDGSTDPSDGATPSEAGGGDGAPATCGSPKVLDSGTQTLVDLFVVGDLTFVIRSDAVAWFDRAGEPKGTLSWPREITSAAIDGDTLVIADRSAVSTVATGTMEKKLEFFVPEACASAVVISGHRVVCGPSNDWDRVFYTFDLATGKELARSAKYTYNGIPMRRVPGTDDFLTVSTDSSPSDFHLYSTDATGMAVFFTDSPYHGDFPVSETYAFHAPTDHIVTETGLMLLVHPPGCSTKYGSCIVKDGAIGTLTGTQSFFALADDGADTLFAIAGSRSDYFDPLCKTGCELQRIDMVKHLVLSKTPVGFANVLRMQRLVPDVGCHRVVLGYSTPDAMDTYKAGGHTVQTIAW